MRNVSHLSGFRCCHREKPIVLPGPLNVRLKINRRNHENDDEYLCYFKTLWLEIRHAWGSNITFCTTTCRLRILNRFFDFLGDWSEWVEFYLGQSWTPFCIYGYEEFRVKTGLAPVHIILHTCICVHYWWGISSTTLDWSELLQICKFHCIMKLLQLLHQMQQQF